MSLRTQVFWLRVNRIYELLDLQAVYYKFYHIYWICRLSPGLYGLFTYFGYRHSFHPSIIRVVQGIQQVYQKSEGKEIFCIEDLCQDFFLCAG